MMNIHDISAATENRQLSKNNLTVGENMHSQSQVVIQQLNQSQKYNNMTGKQYQIQKNQTKNIYSHEVRKQSLQGIKNQSHLTGIMNTNQQQVKSNKFKNQLNQNCSENDGYISNNGFTENAEGSGPMNYSVSVKQDQYFQSRGGIMNRVQTQDGSSSGNIQKQETPHQLKQDAVITAILSRYQDKFDLAQNSLKRIKLRIYEKSEHFIAEVDLKAITKQVGSFQVQLKELKLEIQKEKLQYCGEASNCQQGFDQLLEQVIDTNQEATLIKALIQVDLGHNHESLEEFQKICGIQKLMHDFNGKGDTDTENSLSSDMLLLMNLKGKYGQKGALSSSESSQKLKIAMLMQSIVYKRVGDHGNALQSISQCINQFPNYKDAYMLRGQISLVLKKPQKGQQDFSKFIQLTQADLADLNKSSHDKGLSLESQLNQLKLQLCLGKECLGDAYKKLKKYKQASQSLHEAHTAIKALLVLLEKLKSADKIKLEYILNRILTKIAMCDYYQGKMKNCIGVFSEVIDQFEKYDSQNLKIQHKQIKCNFFKAKAILSLNELQKPNTINYQEALKYLNFCCKDEFDPELHELYNGNALFEIAKMFLRQKDIVNAQEFVQRATDNNYNSKRLSLYRDFIEGIVYLMKRKIKKGVQILTDLLEILLNGQREILRTSNSKNGLNWTSDGHKKIDRYKAGESNDSQRFLDDQQKLMLETVNDKQSTINEKANQVASGKFTNDMYNYLIFYIYIYRSYGYVAIEKYEHALEDLSKAKKISPHGIDKATIYNKWLSRGILKMDTEEYLMASKYFGKASLRFPSNKDAFCLNAISIVRSYTYSMGGIYIDNVIKCDKVKQTKQFMDVAIQCCCKEQKQASLYFFRGLLNYQLHNFYDALCDFNVAILEEEEATAQFHLARGRCFACLSILDEALKDLSIALELDEQLLEAYIFRGKCAYLLGDNNLAFHDFQKLIISDQKNPIVHIYAGNLLMTTGAYKDAIKAFDNADTVQQTALASFQRIRCYCALSDLENAFEQMQLCMHLEPKEILAQYDYKVLLPLISCVRAFDFSRDDNGNTDASGEQQFMEILQTCVKQITTIITKYENDEHLKLLKNDSPMTIQIIPNVNKIKVEKQFVSKYLLSGDEMNPKSVPLKPEERQALDEVDRYGYYRENIFQLEEMYLYRAIFNTYLNESTSALKDLVQSRKQHIQISQMSKKEQPQSSNNTNRGGKKTPGIDTANQGEMYGKYPASQLVSPMASVQSHLSQRTDLSDIGLCSLNVKEYAYNTLIILIQSQNWGEALKKVNELLQAGQKMDTEQVKSMKQLHIVRAFIYQELGQMDKYNQDLTIYMKNFQKINKNRDNAVVIEPFETKGRLCQHFEPVKMNFSKPKTKAGFNIWMRFSFSMPFVKPPNMIPNIDEETVQNEFNLKQIDAPMPESPWLRTCKNQNFDPFMYLQEDESPKSVVKKEGQGFKDGKKVVGPQLMLQPFDWQQQQFVGKYLTSTQCCILFNDDKLVEDIDDLSDMDKVSLISDIHVQNENQQEKKSNIDGDLFLKGIDQLNKDIHDAKKSNAVRVHNGVKITNSKFICQRSKSCTSCYKLPTDPSIINISNQDQLINNLALTDKEREQLRKEKNQMYFNNPSNKESGMFSDDTVSDEDYGSSSNGSDEDGSSSKINNKGNKSLASSKYTHSRFSSNIGQDFEDDPEYQQMLKGMGEGIGSNKNLDINDQDININDKILEQGKQLSRVQNDNVKSRVQLLGKQQSKSKLILNPDQKEKIFNQRIGSIQQQSENGIEFAGSPVLEITPVIKKNNYKVAELERDSMVVMGSKNIDKNALKGKNKKGAAIGLGCMNNLKKNKLAIAFNNLEMEQNQNESD